MKRFAILSCFDAVYGGNLPRGSAQSKDDKNHGNLGVYLTLPAYNRPISIC